MNIDITRQQIAVIFIVILFGGSAIVYAISAAFPEAGEGTGPVGRFFLEVRICGEDIELPAVEAEEDGGYITVDADNTVSFPLESDTTLGDVFDAMNMTFTSTELMGYENNNMCNTTYSNEVGVSRGRAVEGMEEPLRPIDQYRNYMPEHGDHIMVRYD